MTEENQKDKVTGRQKPAVLARPRLLLASSQIAFGTLLSRISGLFRDIAIATVFGASPTADAFFVAFKIPNFFRRMFAEGAFTQGFIPVLSQYRSEFGLAKIKSFISYTAGTLASFLLLFSLVGAVFSDSIIAAITPGFDAESEQRELASGMLQITFPYLILTSLTALAAGVLNVYRHFLFPALAPIWFNICLIVAAIFVAPSLDVPVYALAWAVLLAGVLQLFFLVPELYRRRLLVIPRPHFQDAGVRKVIKLMLPIMFGAMVSQINILVDLLLASFLMAGSISWLYYSERFLWLPLGVFGVTLATVVLPALSVDHARMDANSFRRTLEWAVRVVLLVGIPASVGLFILSEPILSTLFQYGSTTGFDVRMAALSLNAYAVGLFGFMLAKILSSAFFAQQDVKTPVYVGIITVIVNVLLNFMLIGWLAHAGLALATSIAALLNAGLLLGILMHRRQLRFSPGLYSLLIRLVVALTVMAVALAGLYGWIAHWFMAGISIRIAGLVLLVSGGFVLYLVVLWLCGFRLSQLQARPATAQQG